MRSILFPPVLSRHLHFYREYRGSVKSRRKWNARRMFYCYSFVSRRPPGYKYKSLNEPTLCFSGRCGRGSPCEQLCYELHDGMYECDCKDGYILHKNGYSCAGEFTLKDNYLFIRLRDSFRIPLRRICSFDFSNGETWNIDLKIDFGDQFVFLSLLFIIFY